MSSFVVQQVISVEPFQSAYGPMYSVKMAGLLDGQIEPTVSLNVKDPSKAPHPGTTLDVLIASRDQYGVKIKKNTPPPAPVQQPYQAPPVSALAAPQPVIPQREDPVARQTSIERQNALTNAVAYTTAKANAYIAAKKPQEALDCLEGKHVLQVATYFAGYSSGRINVAMSPDEIAKLFGYFPPSEPEKPKAREVEPLPEPPQDDDEIDLADIPF